MRVISSALACLAIGVSADMDVMACHYDRACFACVSNNYFYCSKSNSCIEDSTECKGTVFDSTSPCQANDACEFGHNGVGFLGKDRGELGGLGK